jgi:hypothetical protein
MGFGKVPRFPARGYWFGAAPLYQATVSLFTSVLGLIGISELYPAFSVYVFGCVAAILVFVAWLVAAKQDAELAESRRTNAAAHSEHHTLLTAIHESTASPHTVTTVEGLRKLSEEAIRRHVAVFASRIRAFAATSGEHTRIVETASWNRMLGLPREKQSAAFDRNTEENSRRNAQIQNEFRLSFWPEAIALRAEMRRRLGIFPPYAPSGNPDLESIAIEHGWLIGPDALENAAKSLEALARHLPS